MPTVLVVDDSAVDRRLVGELLGADAEISVVFASNGAEALEQIALSSPDVVVTDMRMPQVGGLELVRAMRDCHSATPVVLMTSQGNEDVAADALAGGAASYVPKRLLGSDLLSTVRNVLALSSQRACHERLMASMQHSRVTFRIANECDLLASLVCYLQDTVVRLELCDDAERTRFGVAVEEALCNAMIHGNLEVDSALKEQGGDAFQSLLEQRRSEAPYCDRRVEVVADLSSTEGVVTITDEGPGFDSTSLPDPTDLNNLDRISGRGVLLMRTFMDEVAFNAKGNEVRMVKRAKA